MKHYTFIKACDKRFNELNEKIKAAKKLNENADTNELDRALVVLSYAQAQVVGCNKVDNLFAQDVFERVKALEAEYNAAVEAVAAHYVSVMALKMPYKF